MEKICFKENNTKICNKEITRGDLILVNFPDVGGSVQAGVRPAIVVQNNIGNKYSPCLIVAPLTSNVSKIKHTSLLMSCLTKRVEWLKQALFYVNNLLRLARQR